MKWITDWVGVFIRKLWRPWGSKGKRMTLRQTIVYAKVVADILPKANNSCEICGNYVDEDYFPCNVCNGIVNYFSVEKTVPMLCFQHGGSEACEEQNKKFGFICPKCFNENLKNEDNQVQ